MLVEACFNSILLYGFSFNASSLSRGANINVLSYSWVNDTVAEDLTGVRWYAKMCFLAFLASNQFADEKCFTVYS